MAGLLLMQVRVGPVILVEQFTSAEDLGCNIKRFTEEYKILLVLNHVHCMT